MVAITIRLEKPADVPAVRDVESSAFGQTAEATLVDSLRGRPGVVSLVALAGTRLVGHLLFSPVTVVEKGKSAWEAVGLGPVAVDPAWQRQGIGVALIQAGLDQLRAAGAGAVFVLGHPSYYPRFGFEPAAARGLNFAEAVPPEAFMVIELRGGALAGRSGTVHYRPEFAGVS